MGGYSTQVLLVLVLILVNGALSGSEMALISLRESQIQRLTGLLNGPFAEKAPPPVVQQERDKLARFQAEKEALAGRLSEL